jgi:hypothetical protein
VRDGTGRGHQVDVAVGREALEILKMGFVLSLAFELGKAA